MNGALGVRGVFLWKTYQARAESKAKAKAKAKAKVKAKAKAKAESKAKAVQRCSPQKGISCVSRVSTHLEITA
ncbi:hypothetical protein N5C93_29950 [Pseudomonas nitroreducens]|uniref:hypothetical protein n=1 Tax=Pseudomonas nitroreducens TaxID=46680 RepID=UPI00244755BA|nr:hypothetical protein [Pseudomonas nitroreducens]MDH1077066.1 hypothetical protein [Pseudomonas nitroreducens]